MRRLKDMLRFGTPVVTIGVAVLVFSAAAALGVNASTGAPESEAFVHSGPWAVWRVIAACASVLFGGVFVAAIQALAAASKWGLEASVSKLWAYLTFATAGTGALVVGRIIVGSGTPDLPVANLDIRIGAVLLTALLAGIPVVVLVWLAYDACYSLQGQIKKLKPLPPSPVLSAIGTEGESATEAEGESATEAEGESATKKEGESKTPRRRDVICTLLRLWDLLGLCVGVFALAVVAAIVTASSLRAAFLEAHPGRGDEFPAVNVLYYGVLFAAIASVLNLPLLAAWRQSARTIVDQTFPLPSDGQPTDAWVAARSRLEILLHLDVSLLRNPLTALTVLSPLLTAALAAFIPQVANL